MKQDQGAPSSPTDDVTTCEAPGLWSRRGSTVFLPFPASNNRLQPTPYSLRSSLAPASRRG
jgi:hypothetical protein